LLAANYEDIFETFKEPLLVDSLSITTGEVSHYAANKLLFDLAQGNI